MRIGCCVNMNARDSRGIGHAYLPLLKKLGYDYAELPLAQICALEPAELREILAMLRDLDLPCEGCNNFFPAAVRLTGEEADPHRADEYVRRAADIMAELGAGVVVFGSSGAKNVPEGFPHDKAYRQIVETLSRVSRIIEPYGITVAIEPLNKLESNIINTAAEGLRLAEDVGCGNIRLLIDYYHLFMEAESTEIIIKAGEMIQHVHFAVTRDRRFPRKGDDCAGVIQALKAAGYDGRISMEAYTEDFERDAAEAKAFLEKLWVSA